MDYTIVCIIKNNTINYNIKALKNFKGEKILYYNRECENIDQLFPSDFKIISGSNLIELVSKCKYDYVVVLNPEIYILKIPELNKLVKDKIYRSDKINIFIRSICQRIINRYKIQDDGINYYYEFVKNKNLYKEVKLYEDIDSIYNLMTYDKNLIINSKHNFFSINQNLNKLFINEILNDIYNSNKKTSLISCILVSDNENFIKSSIENFKNQTYVNKELIIITNINEEYSNYLNSFNHYQVKSYYSDRKLYSELYNYGIEKVKGYYICQWNMTDNYHQFFLSVIYNYLIRTNYRGVFLSKVAILHPNEGYFRILSKEFFDRTFLIERDLLPKYKKPFINYNDIVKKNEITIIDNDDFFILYNFNIHNLTLTNKQIKNIFNNTKKIFNDERLNLHKIQHICTNGGCQNFNIKEESYFNKFINTDYVVILIIIFVAVIKLIFFILGD